MFFILVLTEENISANVLSPDGSDGSSMIWANSMYDTRSEKVSFEKDAIKVFTKLTISLQ